MGTISWLEFGYDTVDFLQREGSLLENIKTDTFHKFGSWSSLYII